MMMDQDVLCNMGKFGCLALCYIRAGLLIRGEEPEEGEVVSRLIDVYFNTDFLSSDCTVLDGAGLVSYVAKTRVSVTKTKDVSNGLEARNYVYGGNNHWVLFFKGQCIYNSLRSSVCYLRGECTEARLIV